MGGIEQNTQSGGTESGSPLNCSEPPRNKSVILGVTCKGRERRRSEGSR